MRAIRIHGFGGTEVLHLDEVSKPEPAPGEVRIKVEAVGVNRAEVMMRRGIYYPPSELPARIGLEAAGTIDALGEGVNKSKVGDRVGTLVSLAGPKYFGAYAEYVVVPESAVFATPANVSKEEAAAIWMAYLTAWGALVHFGKLKAGQSVVITAASSSVGIAAMQIARNLGAKVIASTTSTEKVDELKRRGADAVIDTSREDFVARIKELTDDRGAELFFDPVVGGMIAHEIEAAAPDARIIAYGLLDISPTTINPTFILRKRLRIMGYTVGMLAPLPDVLKGAVGYIQQRISDGTFRLSIAKTFKLEEVADAHRYMESNQQIGKIVMTI